MAKDPKSIITWDDLRDRAIDDRLAEERAVRTTADHYERAEVSVPESRPPGALRRLLLAATFYLTLLGCLGGLAGGGAAEALNLRRDRRAEAAEFRDSLDRIESARLAGHYSREDADAVRAQVMSKGRDNPYFLQLVAARLAPGERDAMLAESRAVAFRADVFAFGLIGVGIGAMLAAADSLVVAKWRSAAIDAALGAAIGQASGIVVAVILRYAVQGSIGDVDVPADAWARVAGWCALGAGVGLAPGVVLRSGRRTLLGVAGGAIGGAIGGLLFNAILERNEDALAARLAGAAAAGLFSGLMIGALERVARQGWLRVSAGVIAGKQFILYRNPTLIGAAPTSHVYLFRDPQVGRRHAAIFRANGRYRIDNLPLGGPTLVNGEAVASRELRTGDQIRVGRTTFVFEERRT